MKIGYIGDYALKTILDLSNYYEIKLRHISDISKDQDIPKKFLEQILLKLKRGGFVDSKKGPSGGYSLSRKPEKITLLEIIEYIEGPAELIGCLLKKGINSHCSYKSKCKFIKIFGGISNMIKEKLGKINFEELK